MIQMEYFKLKNSTHFTFYQLPADLFEEPFVDLISCEAKVLYGLILNRMGLSKENGWADERENVYVYFTLEEACKKIKCKKEKGSRLFAELIDIGLIERKKQGCGKPAKIYVKDFTTAVCMAQTSENRNSVKEQENAENTEKYQSMTSEEDHQTSEKPYSGENGKDTQILMEQVPDEEKGCFKTSENRKSVKETKIPQTSEKPHTGLPKNRTQDFRFSEVNQINENQIDKKPVNSVYQLEYDTSSGAEVGQTDGDEREREFVLSAKKLLEETIAAYEKAAQSGQKEVRIGSLTQPPEKVLHYLKLVEDSDIRQLYKNISELTKPVRNIPVYIIVSLYRTELNKRLGQPIGKSPHQIPVHKNKFNNFENRTDDGAKPPMEEIAFGFWRFNAEKHQWEDQNGKAWNADKSQKGAVVDG